MAIPENDYPAAKKLRILMLAPQPWFQPRGTPFSVLHRIKALTSLGHHVDLATYHIGQDVPMENLTIYRSLNIPFIHKVKVGPSKTKLFLDVFMIWLTIKLLFKNRYDLIHTHEEACFWGALCAKILKIPHLYDMHSSLPQQLLNFKFSKSKMLFNIFDSLEQFTIRNAQAVITICPELQFYVEKRFPEKNSLLIENVADNNIVFNKQTMSADELARQYNLSGFKVVLYYGTFEAYQGIDLFINSAREVLAATKDVRFVLVGGNEKQIAGYKYLVNKLGLKEYFVFTGFVQPEQVPVFVSIANVLVSPRLKGNNSPLKIYSYLRSGKPIVATRHITHTQILNDEVSVLTEAEPDAFAAGILSVLTDNVKCSAITLAAQKLAEEKYSYADYVKKTQKVVELAVSSRDKSSNLSGGNDR